MKANALYHLMQLRAKKLQESMEPQQKNILSAIQQKLVIERTKGSYLLKWKINDREYVHSVDNDNFVFYKKGDSKKERQTGSADSNYRRLNWRSALSLWQELFKISGFDISDIADNDEMSFGNYVVDKPSLSRYIDFVLAGVISAIIYLVYSWTLSLQALVFILLSLGLARCFEDVHLRVRLGIIEKLVISAGSILPIYAGGNLLGMIPIVLALYLLCHGETTRKAGLFLAAGILFGTGMIFLPYFSSILSGSLLILILLLALIDKYRIKLISVAFLMIGFSVALAIYSLLPSSDKVLLPIDSQSFMHAELLLEVSMIMLILIGFVCAGWWIIGVQYYLMPWFALIAIFITLTSLYILGMKHELLVATSMFGLSVFVTGRMLAGFFVIKKSHKRV